MTIINCTNLVKYKIKFYPEIVNNCLLRRF